MNDVNKSMSHRVSMIILGAFLGLLAILACFPRSEEHTSELQSPC